MAKRITTVLSGIAHRQVDFTGEPHAQESQADGLDDALTIDLVRRCRQGDRQAFDEIVSLHERWLRAAVRNLYPRHDEEWRQDAFSDVIEKIWVSIPRLRSDSSFRGWAYSVCRHVCATSYRRDPARRLQTAPLDDAYEIVDTASGDMDDLLTLEAARRAVSSLPYRLRIVMALRCEEELSYRQIGETLGIPDRTVKARLHEGRERLRRKWSVGCEGGGGG